MICATKPNYPELPRCVAVAAKRGEPAAIVTAVNHHREQIRKMAWAINKGRYMAEDLESEGVIGILQAIRYNDLRKRRSLWPLVDRFARFRMYDVMRKLANRRWRERYLEEMEDGDARKEPKDWLTPSSLAMVLEEAEYVFFKKPMGVGL